MLWLVLPFNNGYKIQKSECWPAVKGVYSHALLTVYNTKEILWNFWINFSPISRLEFAQTPIKSIYKSINIHFVTDFSIENCDQYTSIFLFNLTLDLHYSISKNIPHLFQVESESLLNRSGPSTCHFTLADGMCNLTSGSSKQISADPPNEWITKDNGSKMYMHWNSSVLSHCFIYRAMTWLL